jgi:hypothetical protein
MILKDILLHVLQTQINLGGWPYTFAHQVSIQSKVLKRRNCHLNGWVSKTIEDDQIWRKKSQFLSYHLNWFFYMPRHRSHKYVCKIATSLNVFSKSNISE